MRSKKISQYIDKLFKEKEQYINGAEFWNRVVNTMHKLDAMEQKIIELESAVNTIWSLPIFKAYRGKDGTKP